MAKLKGGGQSGARWASAPAEGAVVGDAAQSRPARRRHLRLTQGPPPPAAALAAVSLPAADGDPGGAGRGADAPRGWAEGGEAGRKRKGRAASGPRRGAERAACVRRPSGRAGGEARAGGGGMSARGASRGPRRPHGKSRAQPERSIKMAAEASAVAAASGR